MELILAVVVVAAVIFFGALISAGNERQRKAIDNLREQTSLWAMQDLRIKREQLARGVRVDDPLVWINKITSKVTGHNLDLRVVETFDKPQALICAAGDGSHAKIVFTPLSPRDVHGMKHAKHSRLSEYANRNPLLSLPRSVTALECSILNAGILFDLELPMAWKGLTGQESDRLERLWIYMIL